VSFYTTNTDCAVARCLQCLSHAGILSKRANIMLKLFLLWGSHTILVFPYPTGWQYSVGNLLPLNANGVVECKGDMKKSRFATNISLRNANRKPYPNFRMVPVAVTLSDFCRAMRCISAAYAVMRCLYLCHVRDLCQNE